MLYFMRFLYDKRLFNFLVIIFLSVITVNWTSYIFKQSVDAPFLCTVIFLRCVFSFVLLRDYMASWRKSTQKTFLRKVFINIPVFLLQYYFLWECKVFSFIFRIFTLSVFD